MVGYDTMRDAVYAIAGLSALKIAKPIAITD
jgi:hypothetical protein